MHIFPVILSKAKDLLLKKGILRILRILRMTKMGLQAEIFAL